MPTFTINGVDLATYGVTVTRESIFHTMAPLRSTQLVLPGVHGALRAGEEFYEQGHLVLDLWLNGGGNAHTHDEKLDGLLSLLQGTLDVRKTMSDSSVRSATCVLRASLDPIHRPGAYTKLTVPLDIPSVFWRDVSETTWTQAPPVTATTYTLSDFAGCTAQVTDGKILWTGPVGNPTVTDAYSGSSITWASTVSAGTQLRIDCAAFTAVTGTGIGWDTAGTDASGLLYPTGPGSAYRLFTLFPEIVSATPTNRRLRITTTGSGMNSNTVCAFKAKRAFV